MKASSSGLEVWIRLSEKQIEDLENISIGGVLKFREITRIDEKDSKRRDIEIQLRYNEGQEESVIVDIHPKGIYFGDANKIIFNIDNEYYKDLREYGEASCRFLWCGKLTIRSEKRRLLSQRFL